jgi:hypothetical protein
LWEIVVHPREPLPFQFKDLRVLVDMRRDKLEQTGGNAGRLGELQLGADTVRK